MKNELKLLLLLIVVIVQAGCVQQKSLPQMKTYYSSNKSFCIDVPIDYIPYREPLPNYMAFTSDSQSGTITIERKYLMSNDDFKEFISKAKADIPKKFKCSTISVNDTICHYKYAAGLFVYHQYYMKKLIEGYSYVISANGIGMTSEIAKEIYDSVNDEYTIEFNF